MSSIKYRPEVDGLRTIAVLPVLLFHLGCEWIPGGFLGVDVFFVISGYLITAIILKDFDAGKFSLKNFWIKRVRRIFPVMSIMVIATLIASYFISYKPDLMLFGEIGLAGIFSLANIALWRMAGDYWGSSAESVPFLHTWSLAVEEQFYLFYPVVLTFLLKSRKKLIGLALGLSIIASFSAFIYGQANYPTATFYLLPTRAWELAIGCLIAVLHHQGQLLDIAKPLRSAGSVVGLLLIAFSYIYIDGENQLSVLYACCVVGSGLILVNNRVDGIVNRFLALSWMVYIGKISYSLYIWHWPVIVLARTYSLRYEKDVPQILVLVLIMTLTLLSYYLIERTTRKMVHILSFALLTLLISAALSAHFAYGTYRNTYSTTQFETVEFYSQQYDLSPTKPAKPPFDRKVEIRRTGVHAPLRNEEKIKNLYKKGGIVRNYGKSVPEIVLLGDSHAQMWARTIDLICEEETLSVAFNTMTSTTPFIEIPLNKNPKPSRRFTSSQKYEFNSSVLKALNKWKPRLVIIGHRWEGSLLLNSEKHDLMKFVGAYGGKILLLEQPPILAIGNNNSSMFLSYKNLVPASGKRQYIKRIKEEAVFAGRETVKSLADQYPYVNRFEVFESFAFKNEEALVLEGKTVYYYDDDHLSHQGTLLLKGKLKDAILHLLQSTPAPSKSK